MKISLQSNTRLYPDICNGEQLTHSRLLHQAFSLVISSITLYNMCQGGVQIYHAFRVSQKRKKIHT